MQSVIAAAATGGVQRVTRAAVSLAIAIILLNASAVQAVETESLPLRDQVRMLTSEPAATWRGDGGNAGREATSTETGVETLQDRAPIDKDQYARPGNMRFGAGYESRISAQPRRH